MADISTTKDTLRRAEALAWRPFIKNTLRGFVSVELPNGLVIYDISVVAGRQTIGANGKPSFVPALEWRSRDLADRFSTGVVKSILAEHPDAGGA